ncbi:MAG TPA: peptidase MA family metallohydrolase [Symbiobacteriaceae bacterium]|nr:peptidase MA family metallohydrolase [Symbiobacteriaceae bacterium]
MKWLRSWVLPLIVMIALLFFAGLGVTSAVPLILALIWLGYSLYQRKAYWGLALMGGLFLVVLVAGFWFSRNPDSVASFFMGRMSERAAAQANGPEWREESVGAFRFKYTEQDAGTSQVKDALPRAYQRVSGFFTDLPAETLVILFPELKSMEVALNADLPDWSVGGGIGDILVLTSPPTWSPETGSTVEQIIAHEFTHVMVNRTGGPKVPKWLNEGMATFVADQTSPEQRVKVVEKAAGGGLYTLAEIDAFFRQPAAYPSMNAGLMYAETASIVTYMMENYGKDRLMQVLRALRAGKTADQALQSALGVNAAGLEAAWVKSLGR